MRRVILVPVALAALAAGCGDGGPKRLPVTGTVTYGGRPFQKGLITFDPDRSKQPDGPQGFAFIEGGKYDTGKGTGRGAVGGPVIVRIEGTAEANGKPTRVEYSTTADLPAGGPGVYDLDVPVKGSKSSAVLPDP
jgi:predicted small lipoprotein YifL